jgi:hypothetical protein
VRFPDPDNAGRPAEGATRRAAPRRHAPRGASRRAVLRGAGAAVLATATGALVAPALAGCTPADGTVDVPGAAALAEVITATADLADRYDAAILAYPDLADRLTPLRDAHRTHARDLAGMLGQAPPAARTQQPPTGGQDGAVSALATAEKSGRAAAVAACLAAPARLAPLLGSIAAARAGHAEALR